MKYLKWQREVMESKERKIIAQVSRRSGKSSIARDWAVRESKPKVVEVNHRTVAYVVNTDAQKQQVFSDMVTEHGANISGAFMHEGKINFNWGGTIIIFVATKIGRANTRGTRLHAVVYDDAGHMGADAYEALLPCLLDTIDYRVLVTTGYMNKGSIPDRLIEVLDSVQLVQWDYLDMIDAGVWSQKQASDIQTFVTAESFQEEFGPWRIMPGKTHRTNQDFKVLLRK